MTTTKAPINPSELRLEAVRDGYARGWSFTPLDGKAPILKCWQSTERESLQQALAWARRGNIGLRTGAVSGGIVVIDDDSGTWEPPVPTVAVVTGSGKRHHYFRMAEGRSVKNSAGLLAPKVDVRGEGGQVVFPGSVHPDTGRPYEYLAGRSSTDLPLAPFPYDLLEQAEAAKQAAKPKPATTGAAAPSHALNGRLAKYIEAAVRNECAAVADCANGTRNVTLNNAALRLGHLVGAGALDRSVAEHELLAAAGACGLPEAEAVKTIRSGLAAGNREPADLSHVLEAPACNGTSQSSKPETKTCKIELPACISAAELQTRTFAPTRFIVDGLRPVGLSIIGSKPKKGKSWHELGVAIAVASGSPVYERFAVDQGEVDYIAFEDTPNRIQERMKMLCGDSPWPESLKFFHEWPRLDRGGLEALELLSSQRKNWRMLVIDTYTRIRASRGKYEDAYQSDADQTAALQRLALKHNIALVLIHHQRKMQSDDPFDTFSGTLGLTASADVLLVLERKGATGKLHLTGRDVEERTLAIEFDRGRWLCRGEIEMDAERDPLDATKHFLGELLGRGPLPSEEIFEQGKNLGFGRNKIYKAKDALGIKPRRAGFDGPWIWSLEPDK